MPRPTEFFFSSRRRHTRCSRDWSSDVCSSDLNPTGASGALRGAGGATAAQTARGTHGDGGRGFFATCGARYPRAPTYISFETAPGAAYTAGPSRSRPRHCGARLRLPTLPTLAWHSPEVCVLRLLDHIAQCTQPFIVRQDGGGLWRLTGAGDFALSLAPCPLRYVLSDVLARRS